MSNASHSVLTMGAITLLVTAAGTVNAQQKLQLQEQRAQAQVVPTFSQLDTNQDQQITLQELESTAKEQGQDAQQMIADSDMDGDQALSQQEYNQLRLDMSSAGQQESMAQGSGGSDQDRTQITVKQKPTQITVDKPAPQITVKQPQPKVQVTTKDPKVEVDQGKPEVAVQQPKPEVSVDQEKPEVDVQTAQPNVDVNRSQPQVDVRSPNPDVDVVTQDQNQQRTQQNHQQRMQDQQSQAKGMLYNVSVNELRGTEVVDANGRTLGSVEEVAVKRDGSEVGFIIAPTESAGMEADYVYAPAGDVSLQRDLLVVSPSAGQNQKGQFDPNEFDIAQDSDQPLNQLLDSSRVTQR